MHGKSRRASKSKKSERTHTHTINIQKLDGKTRASRTWKTSSSIIVIKRNKRLLFFRNCRRRRQQQHRYCCWWYGVALAFARSLRTSQLLLSRWMLRLHVWLCRLPSARTSALVLQICGKFISIYRFALYLSFFSFRCFTRIFVIRPIYLPCLSFNSECIIVDIFSVCCVLLFFFHVLLLFHHYAAQNTIPYCKSTFDLFHFWNWSQKWFQ